LDVYDLINKYSKPMIAAVDGYTVGDGNVLHVVCDFTIATNRSAFRQVGPMMGSLDAGYRTGYLEDLVGKKKAKGNMDAWQEIHSSRSASDEPCECCCASR
jgi:naphthoate synthase